MWAVAVPSCAWVINMVKYHHIRCDVRPKEEKLAEAQGQGGASLHPIYSQCFPLRCIAD